MKHYFVLLTLSLTGCSTLSGYDGSSSFSCKAPDGVSCSSLSGVYANATLNNLPGLQTNKDKSEKVSKEENSSEGMTAQPTAPGGHQPDITGKPLNSGDPIYSPSKILRVWIAPWEDEDGDLHDQSYVYMLANYGRWMIEHNQRRIMDQYQPTNLSTGTVAADSQATKQANPVTAGGYNQQYANPVLPDGSYNRQSPAPSKDTYDPEDSF